MIVSPNRFVFIHIPRTGGMAISNTVASVLSEIPDTSILLSGDGDIASAPWRHSRACEVAGTIPTWRDIRRFSVIRNPWDIVLSSWNLLRRDSHSLNESKHLTTDSVQVYCDFIRDSLSMSFDEWIPWHFEYLREAGGFWNYWCLGAQGEDLGVRHVRFEQLNESWPNLCELMGIPPVALRHDNRSASCVDWSPRAIREVAELCRGDIERFDWQCPC